jgi:hypothetical protein
MIRLLQSIDHEHFSLVWREGEQIPPYAILSHTWSFHDPNEEVTYQDIIDNAYRNKAGFKKLQFCSKQAAKHDIRYFWVDTCCIIRSDSHELQRSITCMFKWYQNAKRCYVYLSDAAISMENGTEHVNGMTDFDHCRWFKRGWTLQELLAPRIVEFYDQDGRRLGDRKTLENEIHEITKIPREAIRGRPLDSFTVEERLSWMQGRETKVAEDEAYCLLGIFGVSMPLVYGEDVDEAMSRLRGAIADSLHRRQQSATGVRMVTRNDSRHSFSSRSTEGDNG